MPLDTPSERGKDNGRRHVSVSCSVKDAFTSESLSTRTLAGGLARYVITCALRARSDKNEKRSDKYPAESLAAPPLKT